MTAYSNSTVTFRRAPAQPPLGHLLREARAFADRRRFDAGQTQARRVEGEPVIVIPGFLASDRSTAVLRRALNQAGYQSHRWKLGINLGATEARLEQLAARVTEIAEASGRPVILIGWSLGGLYARELAKRLPGKVARVLTLGSPFSGDRRSNRAWRLYELVNRHPIDRLPIACDLGQKPPVPTLALWSRGDGIVHADCARGLPHETDAAIEVDCSHIGFTFEPAAVAAVLEALARG